MLSVVLVVTRRSGTMGGLCQRLAHMLAKEDQVIALIAGPPGAPGREVQRFTQEGGWGVPAEAMLVDPPPGAGRGFWAGTARRAARHPALILGDQDLPLAPGLAALRRHLAGAGDGVTRLPGALCLPGGRSAMPTPDAPRWPYGALWPDPWAMIGPAQMMRDTPAAPRYYAPQPPVARCADGWAWRALWASAPAAPAPEALWQMSDAIEVSLRPEELEEFMAVAGQIPAPPPGDGSLAEQILAHTAAQEETAVLRVLSQMFARRAEAQMAAMARDVAALHEVVDLLMPDPGYLAQLYTRERGG